MTVTVEAIVIGYPNDGYLPATGLPQGVWRSQVRVTGDASGGNARARLIFSSAADEFNSRFYSLEQIGLENGVSTAVNYQINSSNLLGVFAQDNVVGLRYGVDLEDPVGGNVAPNLRDVRFPLRLWLGVQNSRSTNTFLQAQTVNILNTVTTFWAMGYFWDPAAQNAPGGMKYPTNPGMLG